MPAAIDDTALVAAARDGDRDALDRLLRLHYDRIHAVCRRITGHDADAADAAQEALIAVVRGLQRFEGGSSFATWVYRIATNASLDELRRRRRRPVLAGRDDTDGPHAEPAAAARPDTAEALSDRLAIEAALGALPEEFRVAVVLRDVADLDYAEIGQVLDVPLGTVKSRIARGRALLVTALTQDEPGNHPTGARRPTPSTGQND